MVAFPTETVYGLGARLWDRKAVEKIFRIKGRPADNPLIVHIGSLDQLPLLAEKIPRAAAPLIEKFWPGPLTLVFKKKARVPDIATAGLPTVAVRMPDHPVALQLLKALGEPIAAPSANRSGRPSSTRFEHAGSELEGKADLILRGRPPRVGIESTVLDLSRRPYRILRPGSVSLEDLKKRLPGEPLEYLEAKGRLEGAASPGLRHRHYQPSCPVEIVEPKDWLRKIKQFAGRRLGVLSLTREIPKRRGIVYGKYFGKDARRYGRELYACFFEAEKARSQILLVESMKDKGMGRAIMDRLRRAAKR